MFESAELGHKIDEADYEKELPALREALLEAVCEMTLRGGEVVYQRSDHP